MMLLVVGPHPTLMELQHGQQASKKEQWVVLYPAVPLNLRESKRMMMTSTSGLEDIPT